MPLSVARTALLLGVAVAPLATFAQDTPTRAIEPVAGDVYRFQNNFHYSLVVVTDEGVVVVDPIDADAASWLEGELETMTDQPVTHLIYSHSHLDHASGGEVFADTATVIAHENAPETIDGVAPDIRFGDSLTLALGDKTFEIDWLGVGHGEDLVAVVVRPENVAFIVDTSSPKRLPYQDMAGADIDGWIDQIRTIEALDFEIFAPGHGAIGVKADAADTRVYMETLREQVLEGLRAGKSVDELAAEVTLDDYADWQQYEGWRELNVRGMASYLVENDKVN